MKKKLVTIGLIGILTLMSISAFSVAGINSITAGKNEITTTETGDELDQYQNDSAGDIPFFVVGRLYYPPDIDIYVQVAQSFVPTKNLLTKVELKIVRNETASYPYTVAIRDDLTQENLVETYVDASEVNTTEPQWVEFDFEDLLVETGRTYYIVSYTENVTDNFYGWASNNDSNSYANGDAWYSLDNGDTWNQSKDKNTQPREKDIGPLEEPGDNRSDMCFRTYGTDVAAEMVITIPPLSRNLQVTAENIGNVSAKDLVFNVTIKGGMIGLINKTVETTYIEFESGNSTTTTIPVFGLGRVTVNATVEGSNFEKVEKNMSGFIICRWLILTEA